MAEIQLNRGHVALVDEADVPTLSAWRWFASGSPGHLYAHASVRDGDRTRMLTMHRVIMAAPRGMVVDHLNGDTLDNRRANLRVCTVKENARNRKRGRKQFKGVNPKNDRFQAVLMHEGTVHRLGCFDTPTEAAVAYDKAAKRLHGAFARLNFDPSRDWLFPYAVADSAGRI